MNVRGSASNLVQATKDMVNEWEQTKSYWRDVKADEFAHQYLSPLPDSVARARAAMEEIEKLLRKVREDCE